MAVEVCLSLMGRNITRFVHHWCFLLFLFSFSIEDVLDFVIYCCYLRSCPFLRLSLLKDVDFKNQETMPWISSFRGRVEFLIAEL